MKVPRYKSVMPAAGKGQKLTIDASTAVIRPHCLLAVLRNVRFNKVISLFGCTECTSFTYCLPIIMLFAVFRPDMTVSLTSKTSSTKTLLGSEHWLLLEPTTSIKSRDLSGKGAYAVCTLIKNMSPIFNISLPLMLVVKSHHKVPCEHWTELMIALVSVQFLCWCAYCASNETCTSFCYTFWIFSEINTCTSIDYTIRIGFRTKGNKYLQGAVLNGTNSIGMNHDDGFLKCISEY